MVRGEAIYMGDGCCGTGGQHVSFETSPLPNAFGSKAIYLGDE
jgi:hypothetical protein